MKKYIFIIASVFLACFESNAMIAEGEVNDRTLESGHFSNKRPPMLTRKEAQEQIEAAQICLFEPNYQKVLSILSPLFRLEDRSLNVEEPFPEYDGSAHDFYAQALWASGKQEESTIWFFKAAEYGNEDALQAISLTSQKAYNLILAGKKDQAIQKYNEALRLSLTKK